MGKRGENRSETYLNVQSVMKVLSNEISRRASSKRCSLREQRLNICSMVVKRTSIGQMN